MSGSQTDEEVNVIFHAHNGERNTLQATHRAAEVFVKAWTPLGTDERPVLFRAEYDVILQAQER